MRTVRAVLCLALLAPPAAPAQQLRPDTAFLNRLTWRGIGPASMGGRVSDVEANPLNPKVIYVAFATGGVWRSDNAGTTWRPVFDATGVHGVSELAIAPSDTNIVWAGTGEEDARNSISPGAGVFRSADGGRTWAHRGLAETQAIGRILIHPTGPDTVWVAAVGRTWGPNPERGIYRTTDGGQTWRRVLAVNEHTGFVDLAMHPDQPQVLFATSWERRRGPYYLRSGGPGSALWRSEDGGRRWSRLTGPRARNGLPTTTLGRIGVAIAPSDPRVVYAIVEADSNPHPASLRRGFVPDTTRRQRLQSGLFRSTDGGRTWERRNRENNRPFYYSQLRVDPRNADRVYWLSTRLRYSNDGGLTYRTVGEGVHVDYHALWINPRDPDHYIAGQDGGLAQTFDRGRTYDALLQLPVGQFYAIAVDLQRPFWVCGGLQDNGTWCGPSVTRETGGIRNEHWALINGGDGFYAAVDPTDPDVVYAESQRGNLVRRDLRTWELRGIAPGGPGHAVTPRSPLEDSVLILRGDTSRPVSAQVQRAIDSLEARIRQDTAWATRNRFNWSTPFFLSPHNPRTLYLGGHRVWRSVDRGEHWVPISDDLSTRDTARIRISLTATGGITRDVTGAEWHGTVTALAESPVRPGILWAGTDDGNVWLSRDGGGTWENLTGRFPGLPARTWVSRVEPSAHDSARVYVAFDGHRDDDFRPHVYVSTDFGRTFRSIASNLPPAEYVHVVREHPRRSGVLFAGTERSAWVSTDGGEEWVPLNQGLPPAPVHDLVIHPRDRALVAGTHGRSIYIMDIGPLEEATDSLLGLPSHVFTIEPALRYVERGPTGGVGPTGSKPFAADNPPFGATIWFRVAGAGPSPDTTVAPGTGPEGPPDVRTAGRAWPRADSVRFVITDAAGDTVRTMHASGAATALAAIVWDLRAEPEPLGPRGRRDSVLVAERRRAERDSAIAAARADSAAGRVTLWPPRDPEPGQPGTYNAPPGFAPPGGPPRRGRLVPPGLYFVTVRLNGVVHRRSIRVDVPEQSSALTGGWR